MSKIRFHVQKKFTRANNLAVKKPYSIPAEENILVAFWHGDTVKLPLREVGFILTEKAFYWKSQSYVVFGVEKTALTSGVIPISKVASASEIKVSVVSENSSINKLLVNVGDDSYYFTFPDDFPMDEVHKLEMAIRDYFSGALDLESFDKCDESYSILFTGILVLDVLKEFGLSVKNGSQSAVESSKSFINRIKTQTKEKLDRNAESRKARKEEKEKARAGKTSKSSEETQQAESETVSSDNEQTEKSETRASKRAKVKAERKAKRRSFFVKVGHFFRHVFDLTLDLYFALGVVWYVIANNFDVNHVTNNDELMGVTLGAWYKFIQTTEYALYALGVYIFGKIIVIISCRKSHRVVNFLLLAILSSTVFLIPENFLIFAIIAVLVLVTMQFTMEFTLSAIKRKICMFVVLFLLGYIVICTLNSVGIEKLEDLIQSLNFTFPAKWW